MNNTRTATFDLNTLFFVTVVSLITTSIIWVLNLLPGPNILIMILVMLPLWLVHDIGIFNLGNELNGFFIPNRAGWIFIYAFFWLFWLLIKLNVKRHL